MKSLNLGKVYEIHQRTACGSRRLRTLALRFTALVLAKELRLPGVKSNAGLETLKPGEYPQKEKHKCLIDA